MTSLSSGINEAAQNRTDAVIDTKVLTDQLKQIFDTLPDEELISNDPPEFSTFTHMLMQRGSEMYGIAQESLESASLSVWRSISKLLATEG